jgi:hypothetical protein
MKTDERALSCTIRRPSSCFARAKPLKLTGVGPVEGELVN